MTNHSLLNKKLPTIDALSSANSSDINCENVRVTPEYLQSVNAFIETRDFLDFTLTYPKSIESGFKFTVKNGLKGGNASAFTKSLTATSYSISNSCLVSTPAQSLHVSVIETGIILFEPLLNETGTLNNKGAGVCGELKKNITSSLPVFDLVISCGIHGNETAPIELCASLIKGLMLGEISLMQRVLFIFGNPVAITENKRFAQVNLNSLFSLGVYPKNAGSKSSVACSSTKSHVVINPHLETSPINSHVPSEQLTQEHKRAALIERTLFTFFTQRDSTAKTVADNKANQRYHIDLHTAIRGSHVDKFAIAPFMHGDKFNETLLIWLENFGVNTLLKADKPTHALGYFSFRHCGANAVTIELGKTRPFGENSPGALSKMKQSLLMLFSGKALSFSQSYPTNFTFYKTAQVIKKTHDTFFLNFSESAYNFTPFKQGYLLALDGGTQHFVNEKEELIVFPNANVALDQRALLTVVKCDLT